MHIAIDKILGSDMFLNLAYALASNQLIPVTGWFSIPAGYLP